MASEKAFQLNLIHELFNFQHLLYPVQRMIDIYYKNRTTIKGDVIEQLEVVKDKGIKNLLKVATNFKIQLENLSNNTLPENDSTIQDRFKKGVHYFLNETKSNIKTQIDAITFSSDNKNVKKDFKQQFDNFLEKLEEKLFALDKMQEGFTTQKYLKVRVDAVLQHKEPKKRKKLASKKDPILALKLRELRSNIAEALQIPHFQIFTQETLYNICEDLPRTESALLKVKGMGKTRVKKYGEEILEVIEEYCTENGINSFNEQKKEHKKSSKQITLELFTSGLSPKEIAKERGVTLNTIQSHLMTFIPSGDVDVLELIPLKRYKKILDQIEQVNFKNLTELKEKVDKDISYMELRMVLLSVEN